MSKMKSKQNAVSFEEHISIEQARTKISQGLLYEGILRVNAKRRKVGYVKCCGISLDVCIPDEIIHRNRAIDGDLVAVELLPEDSWVDSSKLADQSVERDDEGLEDTEETAVQQMLWNPHRAAELEPSPLGPEHTAVDTFSQVDIVSRSLRKQPAAKVVCILESRHRITRLGELVVNGDLHPGRKLPDSVSWVSFHPQDTRCPYLIVPRIELPEYFIADPYSQRSKIFSVDVKTPWPSNSKLPFGGNVRSMGEAGNIQAETTALLVEHGLDHSLFDEASLEPLRELLGVDRETNAFSDVIWTIPEEEIARRRDLRSCRIFSIDPPTAKDLDDALHIEDLGDGTYSIGVHIADVSYFLQEGSALDEEAKQRATSVYLVQKVIPMLPPILCEQLCSLNPNVDRLAFSCIWRMNADGTLFDEEPWFGRTVMRSCAKLDYPTAQRMIEGQIPSEPSPGPDPDAFLGSLPEDIWEVNRRPVGHSAWECARDVCTMHAVASNRRALRLAHGALVFNLSKLSFTLDADGNPDTVREYVIKESNQLVEEYMLLANYLVAQKLLEGVGKAAFLRSHQPPNPEKMQDLQAIAEHLGLPLDTSSTKALQASLVCITRLEDKTVSAAVTTLLRNPMVQAQYQVAGSSPSRKGYRHYALAIPYYTHFTSPIRRYADVTVHRLLQQILCDPVAAAAHNQTEERLTELKAVAAHCNEMKSASTKAQERSSVVFLAMFLSRLRVPLEVDAVVVGIGEKSFTVLVLDLSFERRLFIDDMHGVKSSFNEERKELTLTSGSSAPVQFGILKVELMSRLRVVLRPTKKAPIDVSVSLAAVGDQPSELESTDDFVPRNAAVDVPAASRLISHHLPRSNGASGGGGRGGRGQGTGRGGAQAGGAGSDGSGNCGAGPG